MIARAEALQPQDNDSDSHNDESPLSELPSDDDDDDDLDPRSLHATNPKRLKPNEGFDDSASHPPKRPKHFATSAKSQRGDDDGVDHNAGDDADIEDLEPLDRVGRKKHKKKLARRERRRLAREAGRAFTPGNQKAVNTMRIRQSTPVSIPMRFADHTRPVASTSWMGLRDTAIRNATHREATDGAPEFELPEMRSYTLDEILAPEMGMTLVDWDGCVCSSGIYPPN